MRRRLLFVGIIAAAARAQDVHNATALAAGIADGATLYVAEATLVLADEVAVADGVDCAIRRRTSVAARHGIHGGSIGSRTCRTVIAL